MYKCPELLEIEEWYDEKIEHIKNTTFVDIDELPESEQERYMSKGDAIGHFSAEKADAVDDHLEECEYSPPGRGGEDDDPSTGEHWDYPGSPYAYDYDPITDTTERWYDDEHVI